MGSYPIEAHLVSKCEQNGTWSNTVAYDGKGTLLFPPHGTAGSASDENPTSLYPVPSDSKEKSLMCECEGLELKWPQEEGRLNPMNGQFYNPNTENVNDFLCDYVVDGSKRLDSGLKQQLRFLLRQLPHCCGQVL